MSARDLFVSAARDSLRSGRKRLSLSQSLDLGAQVSAVDLGLKPALLYDSNGASAGQLQRYLGSLRSLRLVSDSLLALDLNGNGLIVNAAALRPTRHGVPAVVDVSASLEKPVVSGAQRGRLKGLAAELSLLLEEFQRLGEADGPLCVGERAEDWNLCTVFGLLLGYPVSYWFDQAQSFENCLSMTPLVAVAASASWRPDAGLKTRRFRAAPIKNGEQSQRGCNAYNPCCVQHQVKQKQTKPSSLSLPAAQKLNS
uniref:Zgc:112163 n=1 Tax=Fundulus heteroclitus TaxID=8078 RepID=A0A3Q2QQ49_FUNHE